MTNTRAPLRYRILTIAAGASTTAQFFDCPKRALLVRSRSWAGRVLKEVWWKLESARANLRCQVGRAGGLWGESLGRVQKKTTTRRGGSEDQWRWEMDGIEGWQDGFEVGKIGKFENSSLVRRRRDDYGVMVTDYDSSGRELGRGEAETVGGGGCWRTVCAVANRAFFVPAFLTVSSPKAIGRLNFSRETRQHRQYIAAS